MTKQADSSDQLQVPPVYGYIVSTVFRIGRYAFLPASIIALLGWTFSDIPWYIPAIYAFGVVYIEYLRQGFLRKIPFYWTTKEQ